MSWQNPFLLLSDVTVCGLPLLKSACLPGFWLWRYSFMLILSTTSVGDDVYGAS
jgi:hypothetical protein